MKNSELEFHLVSDCGPEGSVGLLTLNRPQALHALSRHLLESLRDFIHSLPSRHASLRILIITGAGEKAFAAGVDIKEIEHYSVEQAYAMAVNGQRVFQDLENLPVVTLAAINGFCLGGGLELAMACDIMVAAHHVRFGLPEVGLGLLPGYGGTQRLPRYVGKSIAKMITLTGEHFSAQQGYEWGLFAQVVESSELMKRCLQIANTIAFRSPVGVALAKEAIRRGFDMSQGDGLSLEAELFSKAFAGEDHTEGLRAFMAKRKPQFKGN